MVRTRRYVALLILAAVLGVVISFLIYWFLKLVADVQSWAFTDVPKGLGFHGEPAWWPLLPLAVAGVIVGATIRYLPGRGGHSPADGFKTGGVAGSVELPGIFLAAVASIGLGAVVGPEAPVIALGGGLAVLAVKLARRDMEPRAGAVIAATGSFAAISTVLGNPLAGAVLLLEASGLGGPMAMIVMIPGLVGAGVGSLIFLGLDSWTGYGTFSLAIPDLPPAPHLTIAQFAWALAIAFGEATGKSSSAVLFSGQDALPPLLENAASYTAATLVLLVVCKGLAYSLALSSFRGGPTFPGMFIGAAGGLALSHLAGLPPITGAAIGIGAMTAGMLQLPITSVLLTTLFLGSYGISVLPLVIVAVVVAFVVAKWLAGPPAAAPQVPEPAEAAAPPQVR